MKPLLIILGFVSVALGILGIFLPILPTTPFILVAGYLFSKSSDTFYMKLVSIPAFGRIIDEWNTYGIIPAKTKIVACISVTAVISYFWLADHPLWIQSLMSAVLVSTMAYVLCQPSERA